MDNSESISVTAAVISKDGKVLIARRKRGFMGYLWEFPGGKQEPGETLEDCLIREIREELGVSIAIEGPLCTTTQPLSCQVTITLHSFKACHLAGEFVLKDHDEIRWVTIDELPGYSFPEPDRVIVKTLTEQPKPF